jgi:hypothetical protein
LNEEKSKLAGLAQTFFAKIAEAGKRRKQAKPDTSQRGV